MISYSVERIFHFQCCECEFEWSIGDFDEENALDRLIEEGKITCPRCGHTGGLEVV